MVIRFTISFLTRFHELSDYKRWPVTNRFPRSVRSWILTSPVEGTPCYSTVGRTFPPEVPFPLTFPLTVIEGNVQWLWVSCRFFYENDSLSNNSIFLIRLKTDLIFCLDSNLTPLHVPPRSVPGNVNATPPPVDADFVNYPHSIYSCVTFVYANPPTKFHSTTYSPCLIGHPRSCLCNHLRFKYLRLQILVCHSPVLTSERPRMSSSPGPTVYFFPPPYEEPFRYEGSVEVLHW